MGLPKINNYTTVEEYLKNENDGNTRHEYIYGEIYAMAGASDAHNRISARFFTKLFTKFDDSNCEAFMTDMKLQADEETFYYPDVFVACDNPNKYFRREPILVIEVLSPATERADKHEKLSVYKQIPTLIEYLIVAQDKIWAELYQKHTDGSWVKTFFSELDEMIQLKSVELNITLEEIYRGIKFD